MLVPISATGSIFNPNEENMTMTTEFVTRVIDGDTFETNSQEPNVRLADVNTPEQHESGFLTAKRALEALILNKSVQISTDAIGHFGRRIANVWVNGAHVNAAMKRYSN